MVYGILGPINFAHGEVAMFGPMVALSVLGLMADSPLPWALLLIEHDAQPVMGAFPFRDRPRNAEDL